MLRGLGFEVTLVTDLDKANFEQKIFAFANSLPGASAAVFYYAGHGMQVDGRNYMVPVDAKINDEADLAVRTRGDGHRPATARASSHHQYRDPRCLPRQSAR